MERTQDTSHIWQLDHVSLICGDVGGFRRSKHSAALFRNSHEDVRMAVQGGYFGADDDGLKHIDVLLQEFRANHTLQGVSASSFFYFDLVESVNSGYS